MIEADDPRRQGHRRPKTRQQGILKGAFTHKDKLVAVVASEINGVAETAKALRISQQALESWRDDAKLQPYVEGARRQILGDVTTVSERVWQETLLRITNEPESFSIRDLVAVAAESTSKMQLLSGGATSRTETKDIVDHFDEADTQEVVNAARRYLERYGPGARSALAEDGRLAIPATTESDPA